MEGGREERHWEIRTVFPGRFESSDTGAMEQDSGYAKEEDGMAGISTCHTSSTGLIQLLGIASADWEDAPASLNVRLPSGKLGSLGIQPPMISRCSGPTWCLQQECPGLAAINHLLCINLFWGKNSAEPPSFKLLFLHAKPIPPPNQPIAPSGRGSPREKRMKQSESKGRRDAVRKDVLHSYFQRRRFPQGLGGTTG